MLKWLSKFLPCGRRHRDANETLAREPELEVEDNSSPSSYSVSSQNSAGSERSTRVGQQSALETPLVGGPAVFIVNWGDNGSRLGCRRLVPTASDISNPEFRVYAVWDIPGWNQRFAGLHWSLGVQAYSGIIELNNRQFQGIRWKRESSLERAGIRYLAEAERFELSTEEIVVFGWSLVELEG